MIACTITVTDDLHLYLGQDELKRYVENKLRDEISESVLKNMTITSMYDPMTNAKAYTGTFSNSSTVATNTASVSVSEPKRLRVVEYTKKGKVTKVELQSLEGEEWVKVPRIQIEE